MIVGLLILSFDHKEKALTNGKLVVLPCACSVTALHGLSSCGKSHARSTTDCVDYPQPLTNPSSKVSNTALLVLPVPNFGKGLLQETFSFTVTSAQRLPPLLMLKTLHSDQRKLLISLMSDSQRVLRLSG